MKKTFVLFSIIFAFSSPVFGGELHRMGLIYEDPRSIPRLKEKKMVEVKVLPPASVDHSANMPPVGSQGQQGSCVAWATGYYYKTYQEWVEHEWSVTTTDHQFSPAFIYNHINGGVDEGAYFSDALYLLCDNGCASWTVCPYTDADYTTWPTETAYDNAIPFRCDNAYWIDCINISGINLLKQHIADGDNAIIGVWVWSTNFDNINDYDTTFCVADTGTGYIRGGHAQCIVGYDDNKYTNDGYGAFRVVNSWGTSWGNSGYYWMSYKALMHPRLSQQAAYYTADKIGYSPVAKTRLKISHPTREKITIRMGIGPSGSPYWTKDFFNFYMSPGADYPFPSHNIVFDISDGNSYLDSTITNNVFAGCTDTCLDGRTGTIDYFSCEQLDWGANSLSYETPVNIPDNGTPAYANLSITGGSGIPDIVVTPDTLEFSYGKSKSARLSVLEPAEDSPELTLPGDKRIVNTAPKSQIQAPTTLSFAGVKGTVDTLIYDDGDPGSGYYWGEGARMAMRMSPLDSCRVLAVQYFCWSGGGAQTIDATLYEWTGSAPGSQVGSPVSVSMDESGEWRTADFSSQNIQVSGDFIAAFCMNNDQTVLGFDAVDCGRAWDYDGSYWSLWNETYFIRAIVEYGEGPVSDTVKQMVIYNTGNADLNVTGITWTPDWIVSAVPDSFTVPPSNSQNVTVTVTKNGLSDGTFYAHLSIASNDPDMPTYLEPVKFVVAFVGIEIPTSPLIFSLEEIRPNPVSKNTTIIYTLPKTLDVNLRVYDALGRIVKVLEKTNKEPGTYYINWDGSELSSGIYFLRFEAEGYNATRKLLIIR